MLNIKAAVHLHEDDLELYLRGRVELERLLFIEGHLSQCAFCRLELSNCLRQRLTLQMVPAPRTDTTQKRSEPRFGTEGEGTLQELHPLSLDRHRVKVINVSPNGIGLSSPLRYSSDMDILQMLSDLRHEREQIGEAIITLERLAAGSSKRRGCPPAWMANVREKTKRRGRPPRSKNKI
jgi:hypothetical protein